MSELFSYFFRALFLIQVAGILWSLFTSKDIDWEVFFVTLPLTLFLGFVKGKCNDNINVEESFILDQLKKAKDCSEYKNLSYEEIKKKIEEDSTESFYLDSERRWNISSGKKWITSKNRSSNIERSFYKKNIKQVIIDHNRNCRTLHNQKTVGIYFITNFGSHLLGELEEDKFLNDITLKKLKKYTCVDIKQYNTKKY